MKTNDYITTGTARDILKVSQQYVYQLLKDKKLSETIIDGIKFLKKSEVERLAKKRASKN